MTTDASLPPNAVDEHVTSELVTELSHQLGRLARAEAKLPVKANVGELVTEIDSTRHAAARTVGALVERVDVKSRVR